MRGVAVVSSAVVWGSGTSGTVIRSIDGGKNFTVMRVPGADSLDFRDIAAFDANTAIVLSAGEDGRIYRTRDGGASWQMLFKNTLKGAFFDCLDFWDAQHGIAMSDPVEGHYVIVKTDDGEHWSQVAKDKTPAVAEGEASFAASGTCMITRGANSAYIATGGGRETHVWSTHDRGNTWTSVATPVAAGAAGGGIFSLAFRDDMTGVAIGGNYEKPADQALVAVTRDGGKSWQAAGKTEYVSGAAFFGDYVFAVGTKGTRVSRDLGMTWSSIDAVEHNAIQFSADGIGFAAGPRGRVARILMR